MRQHLKKYVHQEAPKAQSGEIILDRRKRARRLPRKAQFTAKPAAKPMSPREALESIPQYWIPGRCGDLVRGSDAARIRRSLQEVDPNLDLAFNPYNETYAVFEKAPISVWWCRGWRFLFNLSPRELDGRVLAAVYKADTSKRGGARKYLDRVESEMERDQQKKEESYSDEAREWARRWWEHTQPSIGYGPSNGSKCAEFN